MLCPYLAATEEILSQLPPILIWLQLEICFSLFKRTCWLRFLKLKRKNFFIRQACICLKIIFRNVVFKNQIIFTLLNLLILYSFEPQILFAKSVHHCKFTSELLYFNTTWKIYIWNYILVFKFIITSTKYSIWMFRISFNYLEIYFLMKEQKIPLLSW